ncbi:ATP-binding protein [Oryzomicrobium sp.]|uniref:ATP-binding protein n=1 Tax=Oryzomicrobium sp. TaxID=1911578 RepID=UPI002FE16401
MNEQQLLSLLQQSESNVLDFKRDPYDLSASDPDEKKKNRTAFVKDIISFANTPRECSAFIVIGVKRHADGTVEKKGVVQHVDDNIFQQQLDDWVYPHPKFAYHEITHDSKQFGVIEIYNDHFASGPFYPTVKSKGGEALRPNVLYTRRGSKNSEANPDEVKNIVGWFIGAQVAKPALQSDEPQWPRFSEVTCLGEKGIRYVLFLGLKEIPSPEYAKALAGLDWGFVADFDPNSVGSGVLNAVRPILEKRRPVHAVTNGDTPGGAYSKSTLWYLARGITGRASSLVGPKWQEWLKKCAADFRTRLLAYAAASSEPVVAIALWNDLSSEQHLRRCFESSTEAFGDAVTAILVTDENDALRRTAEDCGAEMFSFEPRHFLDGLSSFATSQLQGSDHAIFLPGIGGVQKHIEPKDVAWLEEDLELIHPTVGQKPERLGPLGFEFLRGRAIAWFELGVACDIEREKTREVQNAVQTDLTARLSSRINLFHKPGAGGTTIAKRIAWTLRSDFPCVALTRCEPKETVERIAWIYQRTEKPVLIIREGSIVDDASAADLARQLTARRTPSVILQVLRRHNLPKQGNRSFTLPSSVSRSELPRFIEVLASEVPNQRQKLEGLARGPAENQTPFVFCLTAFQQDFMGITPFVANHLREVSPAQRQILLILALVHKYGHQSVSEQHFADLLGVPQSRPVNLDHVLCPAAKGLVVGSGKSQWRTAHELIATEIIIQTLSADMHDTRNWRSHLADAAISLADFCNPSRPVQPEELSAISDRVFLFRDDSDLLGTVSSGGRLFSSLVSDLPSSESRLRLFKHLTDLFPGKPHYWAHLGRFYSVELQRFDDALDAIERAIELDQSDYLLHHMKGMVLRNSLFTQVAANASLDTIIDLGKKASTSFEVSREMAPDDEYGYISEAQLLIRVLEYAASVKKKSAIQASAESTDSWLREAFQRVENVLAGARQLRRGERPSDYEERCRAELDVLYGAHDDALQRWQNLLDRRDRSGASQVFAPPIRRQIVWTYLARTGRHWGKLSSKDLRRSLNLLEQNITEEPGDDSSTRLWLQGARYLKPAPSLDAAIEKIAYWKANANSIDACYYLYVLYATQGLAGLSLAAERSQRELEETRARARYRRDRSFSFEWLGNGCDLDKLVHHNELGAWSEQRDFWELDDKLSRVQGVVTSILGPQSGEIELNGGLKAFFVPGSCGITKARDENVFVTCFVGFSYDGLRAWSVQRVDAT